MRHDFFGLIRLICFVFFIILIIGLCITETDPAVPGIPVEIESTITATYPSNTP